MEQLGLLAVSGIDLLLQRVAQSHQLVDFGDDAMLFGEGRKSNYYLLNIFIWLSAMPDFIFSI